MLIMFIIIYLKKSMNDILLLVSLLLGRMLEMHLK